MHAHKNKGWTSGEYIPVIIFGQFSTLRLQTAGQNIR